MRDHAASPALSRLLQASERATAREGRRSAGSDPAASASHGSDSACGEKRSDIQVDRCRSRRSVCPACRSPEPSAARRHHVHTRRAGVRQPRSHSSRRMHWKPVDLTQPLASQDRRPGRDLVPARLAAGTADHSPPRQARPRVQRDLALGDASHWGPRGPLGPHPPPPGAPPVFGQDSDDAAARPRCGSIVALSPRRELVGRVREFRAEALHLMRDLDGRVGEVQIDLVYPHLLQALGTTPQQPGRSEA